MVQIGLLLHVIGCFEIFSQLEVSYWFLCVIQVIGLQESWRFRALAGGRDKNFTIWSGGKSQCDHIEALEFSLLSSARLTQHPVFVRCSLLQAADVLPAEKERTFHQKIVEECFGHSLDVHLFKCVELNAFYLYKTWKVSVFIVQCFEKLYELLELQPGISESNL
jgi:hypothetical protein